MRYYKGDIVEIITGKYKSNLHVPPENMGYYEYQDIPVPFVGQRFRVSDSQDDRVWDEADGKIRIMVMSFDLRLYKRPLKNWIKYIFNRKD